MNNTAAIFFRVFKSELIKIKNTLGLWSAVIIPLFVVFMNFMIFLNRPKILENTKENPWVHYSTNTITLWSILFLSLFIALITFYINFGEHKSHGWKHLYALPIPRWSVYVSKLVLSCVIVTGTMFFFSVINYLSMVLLSIVYPQIPFGKFSYPFLITMTFIKITAACMGVVSIQFMISIIFPNFIYSLGFSALASFASLFLIQWEKIIY